MLKGPGEDDFNNESLFFWSYYNLENHAPIEPVKCTELINEISKDENLGNYEKQALYDTLYNENEQYCPNISSFKVKGNIVT